MQVNGDFTNRMVAGSVVLEMVGVLVFGLLVGTLTEMLNNGKLGNKMLNEKMVRSRHAEQRRAPLARSRTLRMKPNSTCETQSYTKTTPALSSVLVRPHTG